MLFFAYLSCPSGHNLVTYCLSATTSQVWYAVPRNLDCCLCSDMQLNHAFTIQWEENNILHTLLWSLFLSSNSILLYFRICCGCSVLRSQVCCSGLIASRTVNQTLSTIRTTLQLLMKSDVLNCQHSMIELMTNSYAQKAALWCLCGKTEMCSLSSQLLLHLNTSNPTQGIQSYNGEGTCQAICNVANILMEQVGCRCIYTHHASFSSLELFTVWHLIQRTCTLGLSGTGYGPIDTNMVIDCQLQ
jgi:hypothetical protein